MSGKIQANPKVITYSVKIEEQIGQIQQILEKEYPKENCYIKRWMAIKLLDYEPAILESIDRNLKWNLMKNQKIKEVVEKAQEKLQENGITILNKRDEMVGCIIKQAEKVRKEVCTYQKQEYNSRDRKIDKILTSKKCGIPIMILFLAIIFWITITGANYPSQILSNFFNGLGDKLLLLLEQMNAPDWVTGVFIHGMYRTLTWVISVMLPPMAIFFPIFTLLEDLGYLPRIAFNLDNYFKKACTTGKQALTMCMGVTKWVIF